MFYGFCYNAEQNKAELLTWSSISEENYHHLRTTTTSVPLQFRAIQAIQYFINCTV